MASLFLKAVKTCRPDIEISVASGTQTASLYRDCDSVDDMISVGGRRMRPKDRMNALIREIKNREKFDLVADMRTRLDARTFSFMEKIDARHYLGHAKEHYALFNLNVPPNVSHTSERWTAASQIVTGQAELPCQKPSPQDFCLPVDTRKVEIDQWQNTLPPSRARILFNFYGSSPHRCFPYPEALRLLCSWQERFPDDLLQILPIPGHEPEARRLAREIGRERITVAPSPLSLPTSFTLACQADLIFTPDTGMVHIASSLNTPIIAIYDDDSLNFSEWKPISDHQAVIFTRPPKQPYERVGVHEFDYAEMWKAVDGLFAKINV